MAKKSFHRKPAKRTVRRSKSTSMARSLLQQIEDMNASPPEHLAAIRRYEESHYAQLQQQRIIAEATLARHRAEILNYPGVRGAHIGYRRRKQIGEGGQLSEQIVLPLQIAIRVYVAEKYERFDSRIERALPPSFDGIPVDVVQRNCYKLQPVSNVLYSGRKLDHPTDSIVHQKVDPLFGGIAIANASLSSWGTLGICGYFGNERAFITNEHVASNSGILLQPPGSNDVIGHVYETPVAVRNEYIDAAMVRIAGAGVQREEARQSVTDIYDYQMLQGFGLPVCEGFADPRKDVYLVGAATGAQGLVAASLSSHQATVDIQHHGVMVDQIIARPNTSKPLLAPGDSGAIMFQIQTLRGEDFEAKALTVIGLVHARSDDGSAIACHWWRVSQHFGFHV